MRIGQRSLDHGGGFAPGRTKTGGFRRCVPPSAADDGPGPRDPRTPGSIAHATGLVPQRAVSCVMKNDVCMVSPSLPSTTRAASPGTEPPAELKALPPREGRGHLWEPSQKCRVRSLCTARYSRGSRSPVTAGGLPRASREIPTAVACAAARTGTLAAGRFASAI